MMAAMAHISLLDAFLRSACGKYVPSNFTPFLTYDDEIDGDLLAAEPVGALAGVLARVLLLDVGYFEGLPGRPETLPGVRVDALPAFGPVDERGGLAAHRAGDAGVCPEAHDHRHILLARRGGTWRRDTIDISDDEAWTYITV